ncbi:MAG: helix-turn-helix transcriptional regulator [Candidatus Kariarchaeaceae archaeon]|jgi:DNA-binding PadR family transcriptional regulator
MWIQKIEITKDKSLTPLELLVLAVINSNESVTPSQVIHRISSSMKTYHPQRGTIYPILNRLTVDEFLDKNEEEKKVYTRSKLGSHALLLSIETLLESFEHTVEYFKILTESTVTADSEGAKDIVNTLLKRLLELHSDIQKFENIINHKIEDDWHEVPVI